MIRQLLLVDDNPEFRRSIQGYVSVLGWQYEESEGKEVPSLDTSLPTLVLLDFWLGNAGQAGEWLQAFRKQYPNLVTHIFLVTGDSSDEAQLFTENNKLDGMLTKPFNLERLPELLPTGDFQSVGNDTESLVSQELWLERAAKILPPALWLLKLPSLEIKYQNNAAEKFPLTAERRRGIEIMAGYFSKHQDQTRVERVEWNNESNGFLRRRMYRAGDVYWLAEEWLETGDGDPGLSQLLSAKEWQEALEILAGVMATQWGFTRVRYYRAIPLFDSDNIKLQPLWQHGDGFKKNEEAWRKNIFLIQENDSTRDAFEKASTEKGKTTWRIGEVGDDKEESSKGCNTISWGKVKHRVEVPVLWKGSPVALLSLDRRTDHFAPQEKPMVEAAPWGTDIIDSDMERMQGFLDSVKPLLVKISLDEQERRMREWHERLGKVLQEAAALPSAQDAVTQVFSDFLKKENKRSGGMKLHGIMLLRFHDDGLLEVWAAENKNGQNIPRNQLFEPESLFARAVKDVVVIHDMGDWWEKHASQIDECLPLLGATKERPPCYGSWLGLPLRQGGTVFGLLTVMTRDSHEFTVPRVCALRESADRLQFMLLWGKAQAQRDWVARALAHEYREPINSLERLLGGLPEQGQRDKANALIRYLNASVENLRLLAETLDRLKLGKKDANVHAVVTDVAEILSALYPGHVLPSGIDIPQELSLAVPREALFRILFNLMENACKYSPENRPVRIVAHIVGVKGSIEVRNVAYHQIQPYDRERIFLPYQRASDAPSGKGAGIGLAVVRRLCLATGMTCALTDPGEDSPPSIAFTLTAPLSAQLQGVTQ